MSSGQMFSILLDNPSSTYFSGTNVSGKVVLVSGMPVEMKAITLTITGESEVRWTERQTNAHHQRKIQHQNHQLQNHQPQHHHAGEREGQVNAKEQYFKHSVLLWSEGGEREVGFSKPSLPPGEHSFPFLYSLPSGLPSTFEGRYGYTRYFCKAVIDIPWKKDLEVIAPFSVCDGVDLNLQGPSIMNSLSDEDQKQLGVLCCNAGNISASVVVNRAGFVPGEGILLNAQVDNLSTRVVKKTKAVLEAEIIYYAKMSKEVETKILAEVTRGEVQPNQTENWTDIPVSIPPIPPSTVGKRLICIAYFIKFVVDPCGPSTDLTLRVPILIGSIPLRNTFSSTRPPSVITDADANEKPHTPPALSYLNSIITEPEGFQKTITGHRWGELRYQPTYVYYNNS